MYLQCNSSVFLSLDQEVMQDSKSNSVKGGVGHFFFPVVLEEKKS